MTSRKRVPLRSPTREARIRNEILVDAHSGTEQAMGWSVYLEDQLQFPFRARCVAEREVSPLRKSEEVNVVGMSSDPVCEHEIFVRVTWRDCSVAVPLRQLRGLEVDAKTRRAIEDWHYWVDQGYEF
jgi:hypothetical protein